MLKKTAKKSFIITSIATAPLAVGLGVTLFAIHSNEVVNTNTVYRNLLQGENLFKIYSPYFEVSDQEKEAIAQSYNQAKEDWKSKDKSLQEKLASLDKAQAQAFDFYINHLDKTNFDEQEPTLFWNKILNNQEGRIRELDLKDQLTQLKEDQSLKFFDVLYTATNEQKEQYLKMLSNEISKLVVNQNQILDPFINLLQGTSTKVDSILFDGLKKDVVSSLRTLYSRIISSNIRLNEVQIASQDTNKEVDKLQEVLDSSQVEINEINQYLKLIQPYTESVTYSDAQKNNVKKFLESTKINLNIALTKADINSIRNNLVTFYQQISDQQRSISEIKDVIRGLTQYVNEFSNSLDFNKQKIVKLINTTLNISDKNALISAKANLFSEFYSLKFVDELLLELKEKITNAQKDDLISESKAVIANSQIDLILSKKLPNKELANEFFAYYNSESKELDALKYLNNELKLIQNQSKVIKELNFTNDDVIKKLNDLENQIIKTYSNNITSTFLAPINHKLNESLRLILKDDLKQLINQMDEQMKLLRNLDNKANEAVLVEAKKLNEVSLPMTVDFDPTPTATIIKQIKQYDLKLQNLINAYHQTLTEGTSDFTYDYLKTVFSDNNDNYVLTPNEQKRNDLYNDLKKRLDEFRDAINRGNGNPEIEKKLEEITAKLKNLTNTAGKFRELSNLDKQAQETINRKLQSENSAALKPYIDAVEKVRSQLQGLFENPNATNNQIQDLINQLNQALKELNEADTKIIINQKINDLKNVIEEKFPNGINTPGSEALNKHLKQLIEDAKDVSNPEKSNKTIDVANELIKITPVLFDLEANKKRLLTIIGEKNSTQYSGIKTKDAISAGHAQIKNADEVVARLNDLNNIPNLEAFENEKTQLLLRGNEILLAYEQDKIQNLNQAIQATAKNQTTEANNRYKEQLEHLNDYATVKKSELILEKATEASEKLEKLLPLATISSQLLDFYNLYNQDPTTSLAGYINNLLLNNQLLATDTLEEIENKTTTLTKTKEVIAAKKEYLDEYNSLASILSSDSNWKIYAQLNRQISSIKEQTNSIIFDNDLTVEQIRAKKVELSANINTFTRTKARLLEDFNQAVSKIEKQLALLDADVAKIKQSNPTYSFDTYYQVAKTNFNTDKSELQRENVDTSDINAYEAKLKTAYQKDLALNKLKDLETFATAADFGNTDLHNKAKVARTSFDNFIKNKLNNPNLTLEESENLVGKIARFFDLFELEKRVASHIDQVQNDGPRSDLQILSTSFLTETFNSTIPSSDTNYDDLVSKHDELLGVFNKEKLDIETLRDQIILALENTDLTKGQYGLVKLTNDGLGNNYDQVAKEKLDTFVDTIKRETIISPDQNNLNELLAKVQKAKREVTAFAQLAQAQFNAEEELNNALNNDDSPIINYYSAKLRGFINVAQSVYLRDSNEDNNPIYNDLKNKITFTTAKLVQANLLVSKLKEIREITNATEFNLRNIDNQSGIDKLNELNNYLTSFETTAQNDDFSQEATDKIATLVQKATSFKTIIDIDNTVLEKVTEWVNASQATNTTDIKSLLQLVWDSIPTANAQANASLGITQGNEYNVSDLFDLASQNTKTAQEYNTLSEKIVREITQKQAEIETKNIYRKATDVKIQAIKNQTFTPLVHNTFKDSLLTFIANLETQNNAQTSFTITPDETGELNKIKAQIDIITTKFNDLKTLATKAYELSVLNSQIISNDNTVTQAKQAAQDLITKAEGYYNDTTKMSASGDESIAKITQDLEDQFFRLTLLSKYQIVNNLFQNDKSLSVDEKAVIQGKLTEFKNAYDNNTKTPQELFRTYFREPNEVQASEPASAKNTLIKYVLENAINLKKAYTEAQAYLDLKDDNIDDTEVKSKLEQITNTLANANGPINANKVTNNDEATKIQLYNQVNNEIEALISAKRNQLDRQLVLDNQLKDYVDNNFNKNNSADPYVPNFLDLAITKVTEAKNNKANLTYSEVNIVLQNAKSVFDDQIFDLYDKAKNEVLKIKNTYIDYFNDFNPTNVTVRNGSGISQAQYAPFLNLDALVTTALSQNLTTVDNYTTKINTMIEAINANAPQVINNFVSAIKQNYLQKFNPKPASASATDKPGFYVKLFDTLDPLKRAINGKTDNHFKYNNIESLEAQYNVLKSEFESLNALYNAIKNKDDSTSLATFAAQLDDLNQKYVAFQNNVRTTARAILDQNPLRDIFADLYTVSYDENNQYTQQIKDAFSMFRASLNQKVIAVTQIPTSGFNFANLNQNSNNANAMFEILSHLYELKDWILDQNHKNMLLTQLDTNPNQTNPLPATENSIIAQSQFNKKYKVITATDGFTRKQFIDRFNEIANLNAAANPTSADLVRIDNNDNFLEMFNQFAFTKKDIHNNSDVKSIFSPVTFKVYLKKIDPNNWFENVDEPNKAEVDRRSLKAKLVYEYKSNVTNIGELKTERDVILTFKTLDIAQIPDGTSSVFFTPATGVDSKFGYKAKVEALDVDEAGWNIATVANKQAANYEQIRNEVITKVYNKMKEAIFDLGNSVYTETNADGVLKEKATEYSSEIYTNGSHNPDLDNVDSLGGGLSNRISAFLNNDLKNQRSKYSFDFQNQDNIAVTFNTSLSTIKQDEYLRIYPVDSEKGFAFLQIQGGYLTGLVTQGNGQGNDFTPQAYDSKIKGGDYFVYRGRADYWNIEQNELPTGINLYLYNFNIDYDPVLRKVYFYNSWLENTVLLPNPNSFGNKIEQFAQQFNSAGRKTDKDFLQQIANNYKVIPNYIPTPKDLARIIAITAANPRQFFLGNSYDITSHNLPLTQDESLGTAPIFPLNGGQSPIYRSNSSDSRSTELRGVDSSNPFTSRMSNILLVKDSARSPLYSASINKFWFKIRNR
ncbi:hypothetical protein NPA08_02220 [Mycoplasmopsis citelli]|uniref:hypothetical protein n=1 Tax=Mycoplasmopsis citelli TaxID=171281 RepID=UPI00211543CF|nr:hypothetical protein [Mycoplasmopsis citelli]UUD36620.1 hypothetical protein NPA08_02220 [Mycoplasmopsis citelli]